MIADTTQSLSFGTDPIAAAVRSTFHTSGLARAPRTDTVAAGTSRALDVDRLYPNLAAPAERPALAGNLRRKLAAAVGSLRHAMASL